MASIQEVVELAFSGLSSDDKAVISAASTDDIKNSVDAVIAATRKTAMITALQTVLAAGSGHPAYWPTLKAVAEQKDAPVSLMTDTARDFKESLAADDSNVLAKAFVVAVLAVKYLGV